MKTILAAASLATMTFSSPAGSPDYRQGWCDGFNYAADAVIRNRDHYRDLLGQPKMTHEEVMAWIYSQPWKDEGSHRTAPRTLGGSAGPAKVGPPAIESVDLYVVLPAKCAVPVG